GRVPQLERLDRPVLDVLAHVVGRAQARQLHLALVLARGTYLLDDGPGRPAVICLSYTWCDDSLKWLPLSANERMEVMLKSLGEIYPKVDIRKHIIGNPVTVSWENEPYFMGAFKANLPGH